mgnify:CR=1 FL=1
MKKYIETKQIEAEPMTLGDFVQETGRNPYGKDINTKMVTKVGRLPKRLRNHTSVQTPFLTVCILK